MSAQWPYGITSAPGYDALPSCAGLVVAGAVADTVYPNCEPSGVALTDFISCLCYSDFASMAANIPTFMSEYPATPACGIAEVVAAQSVLTAYCEANDAAGGGPTASGVITTSETSVFSWWSGTTTQAFSTTTSANGVPSSTTVSDQPSSSQGGGGLSEGGIIAIVVVCCLAVVALVILISCCVYNHDRRKARKDREVQRGQHLAAERGADYMLQTVERLAQAQHVYIPRHEFRRYHHRY